MRKIFGKDEQTKKHSSGLSNKTKKRLLSILACIVVFATAYSLILPAITIDQSSATEEKGFFLGEKSGTDAADHSEAANLIQTSTDTAGPAAEATETIAGETIPDDSIMPAQEFFSDPQWLKDYTVKVEAPEGALPEGAVMIIQPAADEKNNEDLSWLDIFAEGVQKQILDVTNPDGTPASDEALAAADQMIAGRQSAYQGQTVLRNMNGTCAAIRAFAIHFADANGNEIQPAKSIQVTLTCADIEKDQLFITAESKPEEITASEKNIVIFHPVLVMQNGQEIYQAVPAKEAALDVKKQELTFQTQDFETDPENDACPYFALVTTDTPVLTATESGEDSVKPSGNTDSAEPQTASETLNANENKLYAEGSGYSVSLYFTDEANIPADANINVKEVRQGSYQYKRYLSNAKEAVQNDAQGEESSQSSDPAQKDSSAKTEEPDIPFARFYDITIVGPDGKEIEPSAPVRVEIAYDEDIEAAEGASFKAVHFAKDDTEVISADLDENASQGATVSFEAESFSVYGIVYTVDFHYEVDGKTYNFSIPGGGFISFYDLVKTLEIAPDDANTEADETWELVKDVENIEFSNPDLVSVSKVEEDTTVGTIKDNLGLACEYSAELTEEQIAEINEQEAKAGDWALISLKPFDTEESLTVTMKNGEQWMVKVTDAQISTHVITTDGKDYVVTVTYGSDAGIPDDAVLEAKELLPGTEEYEDHYTRTLEKLRSEEKDASVAGDAAADLAEAGLQLVDIGQDPVISFIRFFDISIMYKGMEIEPLVPVQVSISYDNVIPQETGETAEVIHFANTGIERIEVETDAEPEDSDISEFTFEQGGFSVTGTLLKYTGEISEGKYIIIKGTKENNVEHYYAMRSDGSAVEITRNNDGVTFPNVPDDASWTFTKAGSGQYYIENDRNYSWLTLSNGVTGAWKQNILVGPSNEGKTAVYFKNPNNTPLRWNSTNKQFVLGSNTSIESFYIARVNSDIPPGQGYDLKPAATTGLGDLEAWRDKITSRKIITDKTAAVADYDNRIYKIDLKATSDVSMLTHKIDLELITDTSRSMYFPATLESTGYQFHKDKVNGTSGDSLTEVVKRLDKSKVYYFIGNGEQATVYALYFDGYYNGVNYELNKNDTTNAGRWRFVDSSYMNPPDAGSMNQSDRINRLMGTDIEDFKAKVNPDVEDGTMCSLYTSPDNITRLAYLKEAVRIASEIVFAADRDSRIGLVTFNKTAALYQDFTTYNNRQQLYNRINSIGLAGGTRQDLGLDKGIELFNNARQDADKIAVLITDGAPNMQYDDTTADSTHPKGTQVDSDTAWGWISDKANALKGTNSSNAKLYTLGLSMNMVGGNNASHLAGLASGEDGITRHYNAENGNDIANAVKSLIETLIYDVDIEGEVTDALDPAFYPVDQAGTPIEPGTYYDENGKEYTWEKVTYSGVEYWRVTYKEQRIGRGTRDSSGNVVTHGWSKSFYAKAKEDFLGGNNISTNSNLRRFDHVEAKKCIYKDRTTNEEKKIDSPSNLSWGQFTTPYVNVDELHLTQHSNTWEVYIGTEVDPEEQLNTLWNNIYVKQVVKDGGLVESDHSRMRNAEQKYYSKTDVSDTASPTGEPAGNYSAIPISEYVSSIDWFSWISDLKTHNSKEETYQYSGYGHNPGTITIKLEKSISAGEDAAQKAPGKHVTDQIGKPAETYRITVTYNPQTDQVAAVGDTVTRTGEDEVKSENIHTINVVKKAIELTKVDGNGSPITGNGNIAQFTIYRAAKQGETIASDNRLPEGDFTAVKTITTDATTGKAKWDPVEAIINVDNTGWMELSEYYILETQAPGEYTAYDKNIPMTLSVSETKEPVLTSSDGTTVLLYNLTQTPNLTVTGDNPAAYITDISETNNVLTFKVRNDITADITIIKTDNASIPKNIGGAVFKLSKDSEVQKELTIVKASDGTTKVTVDPETGHFTIPEGGVIIKGLAANAANKNYVLTEVTPPVGYVVTIQPVEFTVDATGNITDKPNSFNGGGKVTFVNKEYKIQNEPGAALPNTGGPGTRLFTILGSILILGAGVLLWRRRRLI